MAAYGRLDIFWPDGPFESYQLQKPIVGVGRLPGNDIVLDTSGISRYHFVIELRGDQVVIEDKASQNGTYVDGVRLRSDEPHPLHDGEEIQVGDLRILYHSNTEMPADLPELQSIESQRPTYRVEVDDVEQTVTPGAHSQTTINIQNMGEAADSYLIEVQGLPKEWVRLDRNEIELAPGTRGQIVLSIKPVRRSDSKPGIYDVKVHVQTREQSSTLDVPLKLHVLAYSGFGIAMGTPRITTGTPFELFIHNQGSAPIPIAFTARDTAGRFNFDIQPPTVTLGPGERRTVKGQVHPRKRGMGGSGGEYRFDVIAQSRDASGFQTPVSAIYIQKGGPPAWLLFLIPVLIGGALLILAGGVFVILPALQPKPTATPSLTPSPAPTITPLVVIIPTFTPPPTLTPVPTETALPTATALPTLAPPSAIPTLAPTLAVPTALPTLFPTLVPSTPAFQAGSATTTPTSSATPSSSPTPSPTSSATPTPTLATF